MLYERILIAVDFSPDSLAALGSVKELARRLGSEVIVLHVSEKLKVIPGSDLAEEERQRWQAALDAEVRRLAQEGTRARAVLRAGYPVADQILKVAGEEHADLLVVGTLGDRGIKDRLIGSVANEVVRHATCPVLVVRRQKPFAAAE